MIYVDEGAKWFSWCDNGESRMSKGIHGLLFNHWKPRKAKLKYVLCGAELMKWL